MVCVNYQRGYHLKAWRSVTLSEHFNTDEICRREAANVCKSGELFLHREPVDFKNLKSVGLP
jgi:hypothetical protein